jgi:hypothetical protein
MRITNRSARIEVQRKQEFVGSNIFGEHVEDRYVVYSYGKHWPLYVYDYETGQWFENEGSYSTTTSRHRNQLRPSANTVKVPANVINAIAKFGYTSSVIRRLTE